MKLNRCPWLFIALLAIGVMTFGPGAAKAQVVKQGTGFLQTMSFSSDKLRQNEVIQPLTDVTSSVASGVQGNWSNFRLSANGAWQAQVDKRHGQVSLVEGSGLPWIPGRGNALTKGDLDAKLNGKGTLDLAAMEGFTRAFLPQVSAMMGVDAKSLVLNRGRSGQPAGHVWFVDFDVTSNGTPIEGARVVFRVSNGNLVQFGTENLPSPGALAPRVQMLKADALAEVSKLIGGFTAADTFGDTGSLHLITVNQPDGFAFGQGRGLANVWQFIFHRDGVMGTWRAKVDAATGEVLEFADMNDYAQAQATGGVFLNSPTTGSEVVRPMPFTNLSTGGFSNSAGLYNFTSGSLTSSLSGQFVKIVDTCGAISLTSTAGTGNLTFGTSSGTDCTTPGFGGTGNTHASREQFYQVNRIKEVGRGWLPSNTWLAGVLSVNVNLNQTCNAYWNGSTLNFFKSGGGCANTGMISAVSLHEWGHGLDANDGNGSAPDGATGEAYGDTTASLALHNSCIGPGFLTTNCGGYGDACTSCTGVRDIDWAKHASNTADTVNNYTRVHCTTAGAGPCGKEVHCESLVASQTLWDLANRDLPSPGTGSAWTTLDRLWYLSRSTATGAFSCTTGATFTSNGCGAGSWWKTMRVVDDDDGNLSNGTPHSASLFAAFNRHGIACTTDAGASTSFNGCTPPATPTLTATAGNNSVGLSWTSSGTVYDVFRNEQGCNAGFTKISSGASATTLADGAVANGLTYFYQVTAFPSGNEACASAPSTCVSVTPVPVACTPPAAAPTGVTATATGATTATVSWTAAAGATEYHILRSTTSGGPYTQVGTSTTTSFADTGLTCNTTYFYVVRTANSATCETGNSAQASTTTAACPVCTTHTLYTNGFETGTGLSDWTTGSFVSGGSTVDWRGIQTCSPAHGGTKIFRFGATTCTGAYGSNRFAFAQPQGATGIVVAAGATTSRLSFWHRRSFESGFDGATLLVSTDGTNYFFVPAAAIISGSSYNGTISTGAGSCPPAGAGGAPSFTGAQSTFVNTVVDLDAACNATGTTGGCAGKTVRIGFTSITDCSVTSTGWFLDDVTVTACTP